MPTLALPPRSPGNTDKSPSEPQYFCGVCMCAFTSVQVHKGVHVLAVHVEGSEVIPQVPSSLFREAGSVAGLELNKWLSWLAIKPRGVHLSRPPQGWDCTHKPLYPAFLHGLWKPNSGPHASQGALGVKTQRGPQKQPPLVEICPWTIEQKHCHCHQG